MAKGAKKNQRGLEMTITAETNDIAAEIAPAITIEETNEEVEETLTKGSELIALLEDYWTHLRIMHEELPPATIITGPGTKGRKSVLGYYWANQWIEGETKVAEVFIAGESLRSGAEQVINTLRHEAAHALAHVRGIKDVGKNGVTHTKGYVTVANELGLNVKKVSNYHGWADTSLKPEVVDAETEVIKTLDEALKTVRIPIAKKTKAQDRNYIKLTCACERIIRTSRKEYEEGGAIYCGECQEVFIDS